MILSTGLVRNDSGKGRDVKIFKSFQEVSTHIVKDTNDIGKMSLLLREIAPFREKKTPLQFE